MTITLSHKTLRRAESAVKRGLASNRSELIELALIAYIDANGGSNHQLDVEWTTYFKLLKAQNGRMTTNGDEMYIFIRKGSSYRTEIESCRDLLDDAGSFAALDEASRKQVAGLGSETTGFLGRMDVSPPYRACIRDRWDQVARELDQLPVRGPVSPATEKAVLENLLEVDGIGMGGATRLMAIARPDYYFTVNSASREGINSLLGPTHDDSPTKRAESYLNLLELIRSFEWFNAPKPATGAGTSEERFAWSARVALLDAIFYAAEPDLSPLSKAH